MSRPRTFGLLMELQHAVSTIHRSRNTIRPFFPWSLHEQNLSHRRIDHSVGTGIVFRRLRGQCPMPKPRGGYQQQRKNGRSGCSVRNFDRPVGSFRSNRPIARLYWNRSARCRRELRRQHQRGRRSAHHQNRHWRYFVDRH